jgi:hypothetical protein
LLLRDRTEFGVQGSQVGIQLGDLGPAIDLLRHRGSREPDTFSPAARAWSSSSSGTVMFTLAMRIVDTPSRMQVLGEAGARPLPAATSRPRRTPRTSLKVRLCRSALHVDVASGAVRRFEPCRGARDMGTCVVWFAVPGRDAGLTGRLLHKRSETG